MVQNARSLANRAPRTILHLSWARSGPFSTIRGKSREREPFQGVRAAKSSAPKAERIDRAARPTLPKGTRSYRIQAVKMEKKQTSLGISQSAEMPVTVVKLRA